MVAFKKSKLVVLLAVALVMVISAVGCGKSEEKASGASADSSNISGTVKVAGSTSVQPLAEELADAFMDKNPDVNVSVQGGGSSAGIESAAKGTAQIGTSSRELQPEEKSGITETIIANDGIAVIVSTDNQITGLTKDQIKKVFTGEVTDWSQVGGKKGPITVVVREEGSGTRGAFEEMILGKGTRFIANAVVQNSTGAVKTAVTKDSNAVGFISLGSVDDTVIAIKVDGTAVSEATVLDKSYKISRTFIFLTKGEADPATKAFIDFVLSADGQKIISEKYVKIK